MNARTTTHENVTRTAGEETKTRPRHALDLETIEDADAFAMEVIPVWCDTVFNVRHIAGKESYAIGEQPDCDFWIPAYQMGDESRFTLVAEGGVLHVNPAFMKGEVELEGGERKTLEEAGGTLAVPPGARCRVRVGEITFLLSSVPRARKPRLPLAFDGVMQTFTGLSFGVHVLFMALIFFFAPDSRMISAENMDLDGNAYIKFLLSPNERLPVSQLPEWMKDNKTVKESSEGDAGKAHKGDAGKMGDPDAKKTKNRYGLKGPADNPDEHMAKDQVSASSVGMLAVLKPTEKMPTSPFGQQTSSGSDAENALGALLGQSFGPNWGLGGFAMNGTGRGGGGDGEGTIGVGNLVGIGTCCGNQKNKTWYAAVPELKKAIKEKGPSIIPHSGTVIGSLAKEDIRRVVRQHLNEVKYCYEKQLAVKEDLEGRVSIKFIILPSGAVKAASVADSTLGSDAAEQCIADAFERWTFPAPPDGGVVVVTYPITLKPAE